MVKLGEVVGIYKYNAKAQMEAAVTHTFLGPKVPHGCIVELNHLSVGDYTTANKKLLLGIKFTDGTICYIQIRQATLALDLWLRGKIYLTEGDQPLGRVESTGDADVLYFNANGLIYKAP